MVQLTNAVEQETNIILKTATGIECEVNKNHISYQNREPLDFEMDIPMAA